MSNWVLIPIWWQLNVSQLGLMVGGDEELREGGKTMDGKTLHKYVRKKKERKKDNNERI